MDLAAVTSHGGLGHLALARPLRAAQAYLPPATLHGPHCRAGAMEDESSVWQSAERPPTLSAARTATGALTYRALVCGTSSPTATPAALAATALRDAAAARAAQRQEAACGNHHLAAHLRAVMDAHLDALALRSLTQPKPHNEAPPAHTYAPSDDRHTGSASHSDPPPAR